MLVPRLLTYCVQCIVVCWVCLVKSGGYEKQTNTHTDYYGQSYKTSSIQRVDNRSE